MQSESTPDTATSSGNNATSAWTFRDGTGSAALTTPTLGRRSTTVKRRATGPPHGVRCTHAAQAEVTAPAVAAPRVAQGRPWSPTMPYSLAPPSAAGSHSPLT